MTLGSNSFERIHRPNLIGMGVLPLPFIDTRDEVAYYESGGILQYVLDRSVN